MSSGAIVRCYTRKGGYEVNVLENKIACKAVLWCMLPLGGLHGRVAHTVARFDRCRALARGQVVSYEHECVVDFAAVPFQCVWLGL